MTSAAAFLRNSRSVEVVTDVQCPDEMERPIGVLSDCKTLSYGFSKRKMLIGTEERT